MRHFWNLLSWLLRRRSPVLESPLVYEAPPLWSEFSPLQPCLEGELPSLEGYEMLGRVGQGEMGSVFQARRGSERVAVKMASGERFEREVEVLARLGLVLDAGPGYVTTALVDGPSLEAMLLRRPLEADEFVLLAGQLLEQLDFAHSRGVCHRDIKSANIVVSLEGRAHLVDFGLALNEGDARFTLSGYSMGTPAYMAPEVLLKGVSDARSDQYSLGIVFFEMLSGWPPFQSADAMELGMMHVRKAVPDLRKMRPEIPSAWASIIERMLAKEPADRFEDLLQICFKAS